MTTRSIPEHLEPVVAREHAAGATLRELASKYGCSHVGITSALRRQGVSPRSKRDTLGLRNPWGKVEQDEATDLYSQGWSVKRLARRYRVRDTAISALLRERSIDVGFGGAAHPRFRTIEECKEVSDLYAQGASYRELAERFDCTAPTIGKAIARAGIDPRKGRPAFWTDERIRTLIAMHESGVTQKLIARALGTSADAVSNQLRVVGALPPRVRPTGPENGRWKGGRYATKQGYIFVYPSVKDLNYCTPMSNGYVQEHRLVMGRALGRKLTPKETVHHINGDRADNRLENLQLRQGNHGKGVRMTCHDCGSHNVGPTELH